MEWRYLKKYEPPIQSVVVAEEPRDTYPDRWISSAEGSAVSTNGVIAGYRHR
jgi:hypothetical protein